jgi:hypothetical protein
MRAGRCQRYNQDPRCGENESAREGFLWAQFFDDQGMSQGGQLCQTKNTRGFNSFPAGGFHWLASGKVASASGFLTKIVKSTLQCDRVGVSV